MRVLGIDPGSNFTGFGVVDFTAEANVVYVASGVIAVTPKELASTLKMIFNGVSEIVHTYRPQEVAVERVFISRNPQSALKLGQARGAAISAAVIADLVLTEYSATHIKQAIVGKGNAKKQQVQHMVQHLLGLSKKPNADAADALACALCHCHHRNYLRSLANQGH